MSYAEVAAMGPEQSLEEAAAPQPVEIVVEDSISTSSLVDVDAPSVRTVPSDFLEQEVQTETQAARIDREEQAAVAAAEAKEREEVAAAAEARRKERSEQGGPLGGALARIHAGLASTFDGMSDGAVSAVAFANIAGVVGASAWLSYKAWRLQEQGRLSWQAVGIGAGVIGAVGAVEAVLGGYLYKTNRIRAVGKKD